MFLSKKTLNVYFAFLLVLLTSILYYSFFGENKLYKNESLFFQTVIEIGFIFFCGLFGIIGLDSKKWAKNLWIFLYLGSFFFFLIEYLIHTYLVSFMGTVSFRFVNVKNFLISPFPYLILFNLSKYSSMGKAK